MCGAKSSGNEKFCTSCGASFNANGGQTIDNQQNIQNQPVYQQEDKVVKGSSVVSTWMYIGLMILFSLPVAGLIVAIVFACGATSNENIKNYSRAVLIMMLISFVLSMILAIVFVFLIQTNVIPYAYSIFDKIYYM